MSIRKIALIGAGNGGCAMSGDLTLAGFKVHLTELPRFADKLKPIRERGGLEVTGVARTGFAKLAKVTADIGDALDGATHLLLPLVAMAHEEVVGLCAPHLKDGQVIVLFPGNGGSLLFDKVLRERGLSRNVALVEALTLPYATRLKGPAQVNIHRTIAWNPIAALPGRRSREVAADLKQIYPAFEAWDNVLQVALCNPNIISHPAATLMNLGRIEHSGGEFWLYKEGFTPSVLKVMEALDKEKQSLLTALGMEAPSYWEMGPRVRGISFEEFRARSSKGPFDKDSRYLTEDIPTGVVLMSSLGKMLGVRTPVSDALIALASAVHGRDHLAEGRTVERLGIAGLPAAQLRARLSG